MDISSGFHSLEQTCILYWYISIQCFSILVCTESAYVCNCVPININSTYFLHKTQKLSPSALSSVRLMYLKVSQIISKSDRSVGRRSWLLSRIFSSLMHSILAIPSKQGRNTNSLTLNSNKSSHIRNFWGVRIPMWTMKDTIGSLVELITRNLNN